MEQELAGIYGHRVRVRACGLVIQDQCILMVNHRGITRENFWAPPGGGVDYGKSISETLEKEFAEETGLDVQAGKFLFGCELIRDPVHAIELFFEVVVTGGKLKTGRDPEIQIIKDVRYLDFPYIRKLPVEEIHAVFRLTDNLADLNALKGFYRI